jgi:hypothetical protein
MDDRPTYLERAFALARSGPCESMNTIRDQLAAEGYSEAGQLYGRTIRNQLAKLIAARKAEG